MDMRMMRPMRSNDVRDDMADGIELAPLPPMAKDGGPELEAARPIPPARPRLCEAGPCRHYHRMEVQVDAAQPKAEVHEDGTITKAAAVFHREVHHYCYPDVGIETNLGAMPVTACNRWHPLLPADHLAAEKHGEVFMESRAGRDYLDELAAWEAHRDAEAQAATDVVIGSVEPIAIIVTICLPGAETEATVTIPPGATLATLVTEVLRRSGRTEPLEDWDLREGDDILTNLTATLAMLAIADGARLSLTLTSPGDP